MAPPRSKLTSQGQVSIPVAIRRKLGLGPGGVVEWDEQDGRIVVRRAGRFTSEDIHRALFPAGPPRGAGVAELDEGIRRNIKRRHAGR